MKESLHTPRATIEAPAKINLGLEVLRRRDDGYHDLNTLFAPLVLADELRLALRADAAIECRVSGLGAAQIGTGADNLAVGALERLRAVAGRDDAGFDLQITKRIPAGGGLGGGSSDAAAALLAGADLLGIPREDPILPTIALELGSDVPFFLVGSPSRATGRGELLEPVAVELPWHLLLVNPGIHIATPWAFGALRRTGVRGATDLVGALQRGIDDPELLDELLVNDFEPVVFARHPELARLRDRLREEGACFARMSGSGATLFGLFRDEAEAIRAAGAFGDLWHEVTRFRDYSSSSERRGD